MAPTDVDQWAAAGASVLQRDQAEQIRNAVGVALPGNPDQEAQIRRDAQAVGVPVETARAQPALVRQQAQLSSLDVQRLQQRFPATAAWISVPDNARLAVDDVHPITQVEQAVQQLATPPVPRADQQGLLHRLGTTDFWLGAAKYLASANDDQNNLADDVLGAARSLSGKIGQTGALALSTLARVPDAMGITQGAQDTALGWAKFYADQVDREGAKPSEFHNKLVQSAATLGLQLPMIMATGGSAAAPEVSSSLLKVLGDTLVHGAKGMAIPSLMDSVQTMRRVYGETGDLQQAAKAGEAQYMASTAGGVIPLSAPGGLATRLATGAGVGVLQGEVSRQAMNTVLPATMQQPFNWEDLALNAVTSSLLAGVMGPRAEPQRAAALKAFNDAYEAGRAQLQNQQVVGLAQAAAQSKLRERDPAAFKQLVAEMADRGDLPDTLHVDASKLVDVLQQAGITDGELLQTMPRVAEQLEAVRDAGGPANVPITIPVEDFATHIAGSELEQPLLKEMRVTPEGATVAEAEAFRQSQVDDMQARAEQLDASHEQDSAYQDSVAKMDAQIEANMAGLGMPKDQADANLALLRAFYQVQSERLGILPHEFAERYPLYGGNKALGGDALEQALASYPPDGWEHGSSGDDLAKLWDGSTKAESVFLTDLKGKLSEDAPELAEFSHSLGRSASIHIAKRHGDESSEVARGQLPVTSQDIAKIPEVVTSYDSIRTDLKGKRGEQQVAYAKRLDDGVLVYIEAATKKRRNLAGVTMWKYPPSVDEQAILRSLTSDHTSETDGGVGKSVSPAKDSFNQAPGAQARGTYSPSAKTISMLKGADLSTFQHELGHYFLDTVTHLAATIEGAQRGGAALSPGEQGILDDAHALLDWGGVENLTDWHARTLDQQRELHEKFATAWETYLMKGQAPSLELRSLFARFRAWMIAVYKSLKGAPGDFTPEVRGVMDRMIASEAAIREAEKARAYMPLFDDPDQAGMSAEEWAAYQAKGKDATELAIEQLTGKTLRDMARVDKLRADALKSVQRDAAERLKAIEREVRGEVMGQPVYQAWQYLTGRLKEDLAPEVKEAHQQAVKAWSQERSAFETQTRLSLREQAWEASPLSKAPQRNGLAKGQFLAKHRAAIELDVQREMLDYDQQHPRPAAPERAENPDGTPETGAARLETDAVKMVDPELAKVLQARKMTSPTGLHPDMVAELFGFSSGDELVRALAAADDPREVIRGISDQRMLERHGEIATPQAMARAADELVSNEVRARFLATELQALRSATQHRVETGKVIEVKRPDGGVVRYRQTVDQIAKAAREVAERTIGAKRVREITAGVYDAAATRAGRQAEKLLAKGDTNGAAMSKRDQLLNMELARSAREARDYVDRAVERLKRYDSDSIRKTVDPDYVDQIQALLERFDLRKSVSGAEIERRKSLAEWVKSQNEMGLEPDLPPGVLNEALRTSYKELSLDELKGLVDSVKQIEHLGKLKSKLLTAKDQRAYEAVRDEMTASIRQHAGDRTADTRTPTTNLGLALKGLKSFGAAHIKAATWARILDGGRDGGPVWEHLIRPANAAGDMETTMRADATRKLAEILDPLLHDGQPMGGKGQFFPSIKRSLNRQERLAVALNTGNEGNLQRLLGGEGWTREQIEPVLQSLTAKEAQAVQAIWDMFETYRPLVGAMERRVYGKEPNWVEPAPVTIGGEKLRGGYYPIKYDPAASVRAEEHADAEGARRQLQGAYGAATVRRSFAKARVEEVTGRPLLYSLAGVYQGVNETIHALAWTEWLIDANRLLKSTAIDSSIRETYGPEAVRQFKTWRDAVAEGEQALNGAMDRALGKVRQSVSVAGLGFNAVSALMQPLGYTQSVVRLGAQWAGKGLARYLGSPIQATREANAKSAFMENRARTRFRELNELRNAVQGQSAGRELMGRYAYWLMMRMQQTVDVPTWWGGYEKAIADGADETRAVALADQAVIDSQGGGQTKDLSAIEMGGQAQKLFTTFYSFMGTALNLGVGSAMTPRSKARLAADMLLLYTVPAVLGNAFKAAITPGNSGDYDDWRKTAKAMASAQIDYLLGLMVVVREFGEAAKMAAGLQGRDYAGPAGVRLIADTGKAAQQAAQGEFDDSFRKAMVNLTGDLAGLPSAQINRSITGAEALAKGKTQNPAAVLTGYQEPH